MNDTSTTGPLSAQEIARLKAEGPQPGEFGSVLLRLLATVDHLQTVLDGMQTNDDLTIAQLTAARYQLGKRREAEAERDALLSENERLRTALAQFER